jgi:hypothetical protein
MLGQILETRKELKEERRKLRNTKFRILYSSDLLDWLRQEVISSCTSILNEQKITFLIRIVGCGAQMGPLGTSVTEWPIVPAPGDYDDGTFGGMKIGRGNRSTRRKPTPAPLCPPQIPLDQTTENNMTV